MAYRYYKKTSIEKKDKEASSLIIKYHDIIKEKIIEKYSNNIEKLIDIGCGRCHDLKLWYKHKIKNILALEPSEQSLNSAKYKYELLNKSFLQVEFIKTFGESDWKLLHGIDNYNADCIHLMWTIHYCMNNLKQLFINIDNNLKIDGKLIICCMDGELIFYELLKNKKIEIEHDNEIIFTIEPLFDLNLIENSIYYFDDMIDKKIKVTFKGVYGLHNGIEENLVFSDLITLYLDKYILVDEFNFNDQVKFNIPKGHIYPNLISKYYKCLVYEKFV